MLKAKYRFFQRWESQSLSMKVHISRRDAMQAMCMCRHHAPVPAYYMCFFCSKLSFIEFLQLVSSEAFYLRKSLIARQKGWSLTLLSWSLFLLQRLSVRGSIFSGPAMAPGETHQWQSNSVKSSLSFITSQEFITGFPSLAAYLPRPKTYKFSPTSKFGDTVF